MGGFSPVPRTDPTLHSGNRDTYNVDGRIQRDVFDEVLLLWPNAAPLTVLLKLLKKKREVEHYKFELFEKDEFPRYAQTSGAETSGATEINVATGQGSRFRANDVVLNTRTREVFVVTSVTSDALTAVRGLGGVNEAMNAGDTLEIIGNSFKEGATKGTFKGIKEDNKYNYTQILRTGFGTTDRMKHTLFYGGSDMALEKKWQGMEHSKSIERTLLFGRRDTRVDTTIQTFTAGVEAHIQTNVWDLNGNLPSEQAIVEALEYGMLHGKGGTDGMAQKTLLASPRWISLIEKMARDRIEYTTASKQVGLKIGRFETSHGTLNIVRHPLFIKGHPDLAMLLDLNHIKYVNFKARDTKLKENIHDPSMDGEEHEWITECGLHLEHESAHMLWRGIPVA